MYNVRVIEYPKSYQVKVYHYEDNVIEERELRENRREVRKILFGKDLREPVSYCVDCEPDEWYSADFDFDEIEDRYELQKKRGEECARIAASRAKQKLYYIARSNVWEWFVTLTLDGEKIDRYDYDDLSKKVKKWFNNLKQRKAPDMYYLIVPEQHKDGAWHFHGLIGGCAGLSFVDSGKRSDGEAIYNFEDWKFGYSTATRVQDTERVSSYICKYITKTMAAATAGKNRYWASKNCKRAPVTDVMLSRADLYEYRRKLYDMMSYKTRVKCEWCDIDYFEIPKGDDDY